MKRASEMVRAGRVAVAGYIVHEPSHQVFLHAEVVTLDGDPLDVSLVFDRLLLFHKPAGYVCESITSERSIFHCLEEEQQHANLSFFGRLDRDTTGLMILGTDGGIGALLTDPESVVPKEYWAELTGIRPLHSDAVERMADGIELADGSRCRPAELTLDIEPWWDTALPSEQTEDVTDGSSRRPCVKLRLHEGGFHQVKRMLGACDGNVVRLHRDGLGSLRLGALDPPLPEGTARQPTLEELQQILSALPLERDAKQRARKRSSATFPTTVDHAVDRPCDRRPAGAAAYTDGDGRLDANDLVSSDGLLKS